MTTHDAFARDLAEVINRHSVENVSDTPDVVLGAFLVGCLDVFDTAVNERARLATRSNEQPQDGYAVRVLDMLDASPARFQESEEEDLRAALSALFRRTAESANLATALAEQVARIAELERELRDLRGTELNPSPLVLDAQAYGELRDEIAATMGDGWDLDEAEISILIKYVRWLAAGQPRDEDGYPIRRETYPAAEPKAAQAERDALGMWLDARQADIVHDHDRPGMTPTSCYCGLPKPCEQRADDMAAIEQLRAILGRRAESVAENARLWKELEAAQAGRDGDVRAVAAFLASDKLGPAMMVLHDHFAGRIAALRARDTKEDER